MLNILWGIFIIISFVASLITGNTAELSTGIIDGASESVSLIITMGAMICLWSGIMEIAQKSGFTNLLAYCLSPVITRLFPEYKNDKSITGAISMNITANLLGLGNAATPFGLEAIKLMHKHDNISDTASKSMATFVVLNTASIQLLPTTVAALRRAAGSADPMDILPFVWISSACALFVGLTSIKLLYSDRKG